MRKHRAFAVAMAIALSIDVCVAISSPLVASAESGPSVPLPNTPSVPVGQQNMAGRGQDDASKAALKGNQTTGPAGKAGSGTSTATSLSPSATWDVSAQTGDFSWTYPLRVPPAPGGLAPSLALSYTSSAVDGLTSATNNQASWVGDGWALWPGFIERTYGGCAEDLPGDPKQNPQDLCWRTDNATMSMSGGGGRLIRNDADGVWRQERDNGSRVERLLGKANGDNDGEYWKVTNTDGSQYFFGSRPESNSTWTVPVFGDDANEPCHNTAGFVSSSCTQAYRWNLDKVIDPRGNVVLHQYEKETNHYGLNKSKSGAVYVRDGWLSRVDYGLRGEDPAQSVGRVVFSVEDRCVPGSDCTFTKPLNLPDVPLDNKCDGGTCPDKWSPTFWTTKRLSKVTTQIRSGTEYSDVDSWTLRHEYPAPGDGEKAAMWLAGVTHTGHVGDTDISLPEVKFEGVRKSNRIPDNDGHAVLYRFRMNAIVSETGGVTSIKYYDPQCQAGGLMPANPETNTLRCFPVRWAAPASPERLDYFHKYVVESVTSLDRLGTSVGDVTRYDYLDGAAWHYDKSEITKEDKKTWNEFRGFKKVKVTKGTGDDGPRQVVEYKYYRGMHGDKLPNGTRTETISDSEGGSKPDEDWLSGMTREVITYDGANVVTKVINEPQWTEPTAVRGQFRARRIFIGAVTNYYPLSSGGQRITKTETTYNSDGLPEKVNDLGDVDSAADDKCSTTHYARNPDAWMLAYPWRVEVVSVACGTSPKYPDHALGDVRTSYDGKAPGEPPTAGNVTKMEQLETYTPQGRPQYTTISTSSHDGYGRVTQTADTFNRVSKTSYVPEHGPVTDVTVTNPAGHQTTTTLSPANGHTLKVVDANTNVTESAYDALGRLIEVWLPNRTRGSQPGNSQHTYLISQDKPSVVSTKSVNASGNYTTVNTVYDGLLRLRQIQAPAPGGGRILTDTRYDSAGRVYKTTLPYFNNAEVDTNLWSASDAEVPGMTVFQFDGAGRPVKQIFKGVARQWETRTEYGGDRIKVTPPHGGTPTTQIADARGRTVELRQHKTDAEFDTTHYGYDPEGRLVKMTDPAGNVWKNTYDLRGRKVMEEDPDRGVTTTTYDAAGRVLTTTDARNVTLAYAYDVLDRKTATHLGSLTGTKLAEWTYDTAEWGVGQPATSTRWIGNKAYKQEIALYDAFYKPLETRITIPDSEPGLGGVYKTLADHAPDGSVKSTTMPAIGGLKTEQVTQEFTPLGLPNTTYGGVSGVGTFHYATETIYTKHGEPQRVQLGEAPKRAWLSAYYEHDTRLPKRSIVDSESPRPMISDVNYTRDPAGRITSIADTPREADPDRQCFTYDYLQRLTEAWTPSGDCVSASDPLGGPAPYRQSFSYDKVGNRLEEIQHGAPRNTVRTYDYVGRKLEKITTQGPAGAIVDELGYDAVGNTTRRKVLSGEQTMDWDAFGHLVKVTEGAKVTEFLYGADGGRLIRRDPTGTTLYLPGQELRVDKAGAKTATRYYTHGGAGIAMRTEAGLTWLAGDHQGTAQIAIDAQSLTVTRRRQTPFGGARGASVFPGERGFVGGTIDSSIGLLTLGARQYDPATGRFLSLDPVINPRDPQQWHGYAYANNNPVTFSDPSGLYCDSCDYYAWRDGTYSDWNEPEGSPKAPTTHRRQTDNYNVRNGRNNDVKKQPVIAKRRVPTFAQLKAMRPAGHGYNDNEYDLAVRDWAKKICTAEAGSDFCAVARDSGLLNPENPDLHKFLFEMSPVATVRDAVKCIKGEASCVEAALEAVPVARVAKAVDEALDVLKKGCSFVPGTLVLMADGSYKRIEELKVGDVVLATDPETGETGPREVVTPLTSEDLKTLIQITIDTDGETGDRTGTLTATDNHPFWSPDLNAWVTAGELRAGSLLRTSAGTKVQVTAVRSWKAQQRVHNLTVADLHTYYAIAGGTPVLVHNSGGCGTKEVVLDTFDTFEQARNKALDLLGEIDPATRKPYYGRLEKAQTFGKVVGFTTEVNGEYKRFRMDYDPDKGTHINVEVGKGSTARKWAVPWKGTEADLMRLLNGNT